MMTRATPVAAILTTLCLLGAAACDESPTEPSEEAVLSVLSPVGTVAASEASLRAPELARARAGSAPYRSLERALADGFVPLSPCVEEAPGGMGFHYGHPERLTLLDPDPSRPEIMLYAPTGDGRLELVGVEFMVNADAWHAAGNAEAPSVAGMSYFDPNPHHPDPAVAASYTLHVWNWKENPDGMFAPFNPDVSCSP